MNDKTAPLSEVHVDVDVSCDSDSPELRPRVYDEGGNTIAWWSDDFQSAIERHPKIKELAEKQRS